MFEPKKKCPSGEKLLSIDGDFGAKVSTGSTVKQFQSAVCLDGLYNSEAAALERLLSSHKDLSRTTGHIYHNAHQYSPEVYNDWCKVVLAIYGEADMAAFSNEFEQVQDKIVSLFIGISRASECMFSRIVYDEESNYLKFSINYSQRPNAEDFYRVFIDHDSSAVITPAQLSRIMGEKGRYGSNEAFVAQLYCAVFLQNVSAKVEPDRNATAIHFSMPVLSRLAQDLTQKIDLANTSLPSCMREKRELERKLSFNSLSPKDYQELYSRVGFLDDVLIIRKMAKKYLADKIHIVEYSRDSNKVKENLRDCIRYLRVLILDQCLNLHGGFQGTDLLIYLKESKLINFQQQIVMFNTGELAEVLEILDKFRGANCGGDALAKLDAKEHYLVVGKSTDLKEMLNFAASLTPERAARLAQIQLSQFQIYKSSGDAQINTACSLEAVLEIEQACFSSVNEVRYCAQEVSNEAINAALSRASAGFFQSRVCSVDCYQGLTPDNMAGF